MKHQLRPTIICLGIIMLVNLLKEESKESCKKESKQASQAIGAAAPQPER
jgi:hypothetical protein